VTISIAGIKTHRHGQAGVQRDVVFVAPQRLQRYSVTRRPCLLSKRLSVAITHLWKPRRHRVLPCACSAAAGFLKRTTSPTTALPGDGPCCQTRGIHAQLRRALLSFVRNRCNRDGAL